MKQQKDPIPDELTPQEDDEWMEYYERHSKKECTCNLLEPYGHVMCPKCNESL